MTMHIWRGKRVDSIDGLLPGLDAEIEETTRETLRTRDVVDALDAISVKLASGDCEKYLEALEKDGSEDPGAIVAALAANIRRGAVIRKLEAELGTDDPFELRRIRPGEQHYEAWKPRGVLVHITAGNSPIVAPMATVEGLLTGNINIVKVASNIGEFASVFLEDISSFSNIGHFVYMARVSSKRKDVIQAFIDRADCVSVWGGEEAISSVKAMVPGGVPVVEWGHKISFAYITPSGLTDATMDGVAASVCRNEQQSCSSPQCVLIDTDDRALVDAAAEKLAAALGRAKASLPRKAPDTAQSAEITAVKELHLADLYYNDGRVIEDPDRTYRVLVSYGTKFMPSPLFRTVWLSPLRREDLPAMLRGMRQYLQTAGLACSLDELEPVSSALYSAGVDRITPVGSMSANYIGEPHDGGHALPRFLRRVTMRMDMPMNGISTFQELREPETRVFEGPIQGKKDYPPIPADGVRIVTKSGGTTGEPVYCAYTERDYRRYIVEPSAKALTAEGIDVSKDVVADLLKSGNLYGGMNFFISVFDELALGNLNIGGLDDLGLVAKYMIKGRATAVLGAPSYIIRLFQTNSAALKEYGRVKKVFYAGELMTAGQRRYLEEECGIEEIYGMVYGANETGSMGYACKFCAPETFHLFADIQSLEIVKMDSDEPVGPGEAGRMLFTGFLKEEGHTERYEIGDLGEWVPGRCPCGRKEPMFKLHGRYGDVIRVGGTFFNYHRIAAILSNSLGYKGLLQIVLEMDGLTERMTLRVEEPGPDASDVRDVLVSEYDSFAKTVPTGLVELVIAPTGPGGFEMNTTSIKLRSIVDRRS